MAVTGGPVPRLALACVAVVSLPVACRSVTVAFYSHAANTFGAGQSVEYAEEKP